MKILLSIKPEYAEKILNGTKRFEYRRVIFKRRDVRSVVIYATKPVGKVVGEFQVGGLLTENPRSLWASTKQHAGITKQFFMSYFDNRNQAFAIRVAKPTRYEQPLPLDHFVQNGPAPQSFRYLE